MTKGDLIFKWRNTDFHPARQIIPAIIVAVIFAFFFSILNVRFNTSGNASLKNGSVLFFPDDEIGRAWRLKAEEEGPFPGRLEIGGSTALLDSTVVVGLSGADLWSNYSIKMKPMQPSDGLSVDRIAPKGLRYLPPRKSDTSTASNEPVESAGVAMMPVLIPYSKVALNWLPETLSPFSAKLEEGTTSASWRFLLNLRANGSVAQCFSLSGGREASLLEMIKWLESQRFKESEEELRWIGLRVEFLNKKSDESDPE